MANAPLSQVDQDLLRLLALDARVTNRSLALQLGMTEGTVRSRIRRLQQDGLLSFSVVVGLAAARKSQLAFINIEADIERMVEVATEISNLPFIHTVLLTTGQFNITAMGFFEDLEAVVQTASERVLLVDGVRHVETSIAVTTVKHNSGIAKITRSSSVS